MKFSNLKKVLIGSFIALTLGITIVWYKGGLEKIQTPDISSLFSYLTESSLERSTRELNEAQFNLKTLELLYAYNNAIIAEKKETVAALDQAKAAWVALVLDQAREARDDGKSKKAHAAWIIKRIRKGLEHDIALSVRTMGTEYAKYYSPSLLSLIIDVLVQAREATTKVALFPEYLKKSEVEISIWLYMERDRRKRLTEAAEGPVKTDAEIIEEAKQELRTWLETTLDLAYREWLRTCEEWLRKGAKD